MRSFIPSKIPVLLMLLSGLCLSVLAEGEQEAQKPKVEQATGWSLSELIDALKQNNPQLRSASESARAVELGISPAQALDNPTLSVTQDPLRNSPLNVNSSTGMAWGISQNFMWPGKKRLAGEVVKAQADLSKEQVNLLKLQLIGQLRTTWSNWQQTAIQIDLTKVQVQRLEQIKQITKIRYANNAAAYADYINAQVAQAQLETDLLGLQRQQKILEDQISALIGRKEPLKLKMAEVAVDQAKTNLDGVEAKALDINPQVKASQFVIESARKSVELAELGKLPDLSVGVLAHSSSPPWGFSNNNSYGLNLGVTLPLYYGQKEKNLIDQAKAYLASTLENDESLRQQVIFGVRSSYHQWTQSLDQLKLIEERVLKQAQIGYRLTLSAYSTGQASYTDLLNAFNALKTSEIQREQSRSFAIQAKVALDVAVGLSE